MDIEKIVKIFCTERSVEYTKVHSNEICNVRVYYTRYMIWHYLHYNHKMSAGKLSKTFGRSRGSIFRGIRILRYQMRYNANLRMEYNATVEKAENGE